MRLVEKIRNYFTEDSREIPDNSPETLINNAKRRLENMLNGGEQNTLTDSTVKIGRSIHSHGGSSHETFVVKFPNGTRMEFTFFAPMEYGGYNLPARGRLWVKGQKDYLYTADSKEIDLSARIVSLFPSRPQLTASAIVQEVESQIQTTFKKPISP